MPEIQQVLADTWPALLAVVAALVIVVRVVRRVLPVLRRVGHLVDDLTGEPARTGVAARPGVMERLAAVETCTAELRPNGGGSIKDAVNRIDARVEHLGQRLDAVERVVVPSRPTGTP